MIVGRERQRHQHRAQAGGLQLGDGHGAGAAHREIRPRVGRGHVLDERQHVAPRPWLARTRRARSRGRARRPDGAPADAARAPERDSACGTHGVQALRALAAAEHQQARARPLRSAKRTRRRRQRGDVGAHRIADACARARSARSCRETLPAPGSPCAPASGWSGRRSHSVRGSAAECAAATRRCRPARSRSRRRPAPTRGRTRRSTPSGLQHARSAMRNGASSQVSQALAANARDAHPLDRKAVRRHQARLPCCRARRATPPRRRARAAPWPPPAPGTRGRRCRRP